MFSLVLAIWTVSFVSSHQVRSEPCHDNPRLRCATTHTTTTTALTCHPGNEKDLCTTRCDYCLSAYECGLLGHIGCGHSQCTWFENSGPLGGSCQSPSVSTTTTTTTTALICHPGNQLDQCMLWSASCNSTQQCESLCESLGMFNIGCDGSQCTWVPKINPFGGVCLSSHATTTPNMQTTTTTPVPTTTPLTCHPGNSLDLCMSVCDYCEKAEQCTELGSIGCDQSQCTWVVQTNSTHGGVCQSPHATTTPTTTPGTGCVPHTSTDPCFTRGTYAHSEDACSELGPIGCQHQMCHYYATPDGTEACGSYHATTTLGPCVPGTATDRCFTTCDSDCTQESNCLGLGAQGCGGVACSWVDGRCQSSPSFFELV